MWSPHGARVSPSPLEELPDEEVPQGVQGMSEAEAAAAAEEGVQVQGVEIKDTTLDLPALRWHADHIGEQLCCSNTATQPEACRALSIFIRRNGASKLSIHVWKSAAAFVYKSWARKCGCSVVGTRCTGIASCSSCGARPPACVRFVGP